jgi:cytochrome c553
MGSHASRWAILTVAGSAALAVAIASAQVKVPPPPWAYGYASAGAEPTAPPCPEEAKALDCARAGAPRNDDGTRLRLEGTDRAFTETEVYADYGPADWYPGDHPSMPDIVARGRERDGLRACALCHYPNGQGKPENGHVAGLPVQYFIDQIELFRSGGRRSADPRKANMNEMIQIARWMTDEDVRQAAEYYGSMTWTPWVTVVESETAPRTRHTTNGLFLPLEEGGTEPLGRRIVEVPEHPARTERQRDPRAGFLAYVPVGSVTRGEALVTTGGGKTVPCSICHGDDLQGVGNVPGIADRTASYTVRQLVNIQHGTRASALMEQVVAGLTEDDVIAIAAYLASR